MRLCTTSILAIKLTKRCRNDSYGWHMQYLTIIGLSLATATFTVGLLADITMNSTLFQIKNALSVASAPMECLISLLYWGLRAVRLATTICKRSSPLIPHPDRPEARPPRLGAAAPPPHRHLLPRDPLVDACHRSPLLLAAVHHRLPACFGVERMHCIWVLVLD